MDRCLRPEDLGSDLSLDDLGRRHIEDCPRCRLLLRQYEDFLATDILPAEADAGSASQELSRRLAAAIPTLTLVDEAGNGSRPSPRSHDERARRRLPRSGRPLLAMAAILVCCLGLLTIRHRLLAPEPTLTGNQPVLRGDQDGGVRLMLIDDILVWQAPSAIDQTVVVLFDASLEELARIPVTGAEELSLIGHPQRAAIAYARVLFLQAGDEVEKSQMLMLP